MTMADLDAFEAWLNAGGREEEKRMQEQSRRHQFIVNGTQFEVWLNHTHKRVGSYTARVGTYEQDFTCEVNSHKDVLLTFLDEAAKAGKIDRETANWPEDQIEEIDG